MAECEFSEGMLPCLDDTSNSMFYAAGEWRYLCGSHILHYWPDGVVPEALVDLGEDDEEDEDHDEDCDGCKYCNPDEDDGFEDKLPYD